MDTTEFIKEIKTMSRADLIAAKDELSVDKDLPKQVKGQLINEINNRLSILKSRPKIQNSGFFYSFMDEGEAVSCISTLAIGDFIVEAEPDAVISVFPLTARQYEEMRAKDWSEFS